MNFNKTLLVAIVFILSLGNLFSQSENKKKKISYNINIGGGMSMVHLPFSIYSWSGAESLSQSNEFVPTLEAGVLYSIAKNHHLTAGIGFHQFKNDVVVYDQNYGTYVFRFTNEFIGLQLGYRMDIKNRFFLENQIVLETRVSSNSDLKTQSIANKSRIGFYIPTSPNMRLTINAFYHTAVTDFANEFSSTNFKPYTLGAEFGYVFNF